MHLVGVRLACSHQTRRIALGRASVLPTAHRNHDYLAAFQREYHTPLGWQPKHTTPPVLV